MNFESPNNHFKQSLNTKQNSIKSNISKKNKDNTLFYKKTYLTNSIKKAINKLNPNFNDIKRSTFKNSNNGLETDLLFNYNTDNYQFDELDNSNDLKFINDSKVKLCLTLELLNLNQTNLENFNRHKTDCKLCGMSHEGINFTNNHIKESYAYIDKCLKSSLSNNYLSGIIKSFALNTVKGTFKTKNDNLINVLLDINKPENYLEIWPKVSFFGLYNAFSLKNLSKNNLVSNSNDICNNNDYSKSLEFIKNNLHKFIINNNYFPLQPYKAIKHGFNEIQNSLMSNNLLKNNSCLTGCTLIILMFVNNKAYVVNLGNSRAIISCNKLSNIYDITIDHGLNNLEEVNRIINYDKSENLYHNSNINTIINNTNEKISNSSNNKNINKSKYSTNIRNSCGPLTINKKYSIQTNLSRLIGNNYGNTNYESKKLIADPDITSLVIENNDDYIYIGSDGIFSVLDTKDISMIVLVEVIKYKLNKEGRNLEYYYNITNSNNKNFNDNTQYTIESLNSLNIKESTKTEEISNLIKNINDSIIKYAIYKGSTNNVTGLFICFSKFIISLNLPIEELINKYININSIKDIKRIKDQEVKEFKLESTVVFS